MNGRMVALWEVLLLGGLGRSKGVLWQVQPTGTIRYFERH